MKEEAYERAASDREAFCAEQAERLDWGQKWDRVLDWDNPPFAKWFVGGTINAAYNCVDRHVEAAARAEAVRAKSGSCRSRIPRPAPAVRHAPRKS